MSTTESRRSMRNPLNVAEDRIQEARNRIRGKMSDVSQMTFQSWDSVSQSEEEMLQSHQSPVVLIDDESFEEEEEEVPYEVSKESSKSFDVEASSNDKKSLSNDTKWVLQHLKRPLVLGIREIVAKQPRDPVDYLTRWLLNYRSCQEMLVRRRQDDEKLTLLRSQLHQSLQTEEEKEEEERLAMQAKGDGEDQKLEVGGGLADWNFGNYNTTQMA